MCNKLTDECVKYIVALPSLAILELFPNLTAVGVSKLNHCYRLQCVLFDRNPGGEALHNFLKSMYFSVSYKVREE